MALKMRSCPRKTCTGDRFASSTTVSIDSGRIDLINGKIASWFLYVYKASKDGPDQIALCEILRIHTPLDDVELFKHIACGSLNARVISHQSLVVWRGENQKGEGLYPTLWTCRPLHNCSNCSTVSLIVPAIMTTAFAYCILLSSNEWVDPCGCGRWFEVVVHQLVVTTDRRACPNTPGNIRTLHVRTNLSDLYFSNVKCGFKFLR